MLKFSKNLSIVPLSSEDRRVILWIALGRARADSRRMKKVVVFSDSGIFIQTVNEKSGADKAEA